MTLNQIVSNIRDTYVGISSDDSNLSERQITMWVSYYRARLIKEYYEKRQYIDSKLVVQDLGCIPLDCVDKNDCCKLNLPIHVKRSRTQIPHFLDLPHGAGVTFIGLIDKITPISIYDISNIYWSKFERYSKNNRKAYILNGYIYIDAPQGDIINFINAQGIFSSPEKVAEFSECDGKPCFDASESEYPIPDFLIQIMTEMILKTEMQISFNRLNINDNTNDAKENPNTLAGAKE